MVVLMAREAAAVAQRPAAAVVPSTNPQKPGSTA